jgi:hypothetical protein
MAIQTEFTAPTQAELLGALEALTNAFMAQSMALQEATGNPQHNHMRWPCYLKARTLMTRGQSAKIIANATPEMKVLATRIHVSAPQASEEQCILWAYEELRVAACDAAYSRD